MSASLKGRGDLSEIKKNNNLSDSSVVILKHTFFALAAIEFFQKGKDGIFAEDIRVKDEKTGREFSFNLSAKEC